MRGEGFEEHQARIYWDQRGAGKSRDPDVIDVMWPEVSKLNLLELAPALSVPMFFFLGRRDHFVPAAR